MWAHGARRKAEVGDAPQTLGLAAAETGAREGLRYVYAGNLPGQVGEWENTRCPRCRELLVERYGFRVLRNRVADGRCPKCAQAIPGFWKVPEADQRVEDARPPSAGS